jgi:hypothetical protein
MQTMEVNGKIYKRSDGCLYTVFPQGYIDWTTETFYPNNLSTTTISYHEERTDPSEFYTPDDYQRHKNELIKSSKLYTPKKEYDNSTAYDSDWD